MQMRFSTSLTLIMSLTAIFYVSNLVAGFINHHYYRHDPYSLIATTKRWSTQTQQVFSVESTLGTYEATSAEHLQIGNRVIFRIDRGVHIGTIRSIREEPINSTEYLQIDRIASERDLQSERELELFNDDILQRLRELQNSPPIQAQQIHDALRTMNFSHVVTRFDTGSITIFYSSRYWVAFNELARYLYGIYRKRIWFKSEQN